MATRSNHLPSLCRLALAVFAAALLVTRMAAADTSSDPRITSWLVAPSGAYARLYETAAAGASGTSITTWSRGQGVQSAPSYAGVMQISSSNDWVYLRSSGLGYHVMGPWYINAAQTINFPNFPANTGVLFRFPRNPSVPATKALTSLGAIGYFVDGVALYDNRDAFSYSTSRGSDANPMAGFQGDGIWNRDAYVNEAVTFDPAFAHQAGAQYHYHANTPALRYLLGDHVDYDATNRGYREQATAAVRHSPILAWTVDGYPLYGPYGYASAMDVGSGIRRMISGYVKRDGTNSTTNLAATGRTTLPSWAARTQNRNATLSASQYGPAVSANYTLGHYLEDYDYLGDHGYVQGTDFDLDASNGRFCVTPEFPQGTYAYFMAIETEGTPKFPYNLGREFYGSPTGGAVNSISETVTEHERGGQALPIEVTAVAVNDDALLTWSSVEGATYGVSTSSDGITFTSLASGITSAGLSTTFTTATRAAYYKITLTALATFDTDGTGGISGLNGTGTVAFSVGSTGTARLVNLSSRVEVGGSAGTPIAGFVSSGTGSMSVLVRAVGPGLATFGVNGTLANPSLSLYSGSTLLGANDNWLSADAAVIAQTGAFALASGSTDAALVATVASGAYTTPVGDSGGAGIVLLEVYDAAHSDSARLINASTRAFVGTGEQVLIPGFVIEGQGTLTLLLRAVGPTLAGYGVGGVLTDPKLTLYQTSTALASNDNWSDAANASAITTATSQAGAFALPGGSLDAAMLTTLGAGAYTVVISGADGGSGTALFELYVAQ